MVMLRYRNTVDRYSKRAARPIQPKTTLQNGNAVDRYIRSAAWTLPNGNVTVW